MQPLLSRRWESFTKPMYAILHDWIRGQLTFSNSNQQMNSPTVHYHGRLSADNSSIVRDESDCHTVCQQSRSYRNAAQHRVRVTARGAWCGHTFSPRTEEETTYRLQYVCDPICGPPLFLPVTSHCRYHTHATPGGERCTATLTSTLLI